VARGNPGNFQGTHKEENDSTSENPGEPEPKERDKGERKKILTEVKRNCLTRSIGEKKEKSFRLLATKKKSDRGAKLQRPRPRRQGKNLR